MQRAKIAEAELAHETLGSGEPVVFIHGAFIADAFRPLLTESKLVDRYRLIHYHRRGYANSSHTSGPTSIAQGAADCSALLRYLGVERAHVVGHSYGGSVALQLALDSPDLVGTLALLEPALMAGESAKGYRDALVHGAERYREAGAATVVDEFLEARLPEYRDMLDHVLPGAFDQAVSDAGTCFDSELSGLLDWHFGESEAQRISQPVLSVLGGESDALWPRFGETHRLLLAWLPQVEGFVLPGTTHLMHIQNPQALSEALAAFWSRHPLPA